MSSNLHTKMLLNDPPLMFICVAVAKLYIVLVVGLCPKIVRESEYGKGNIQTEKIHTDLLIVQFEQHTNVPMEHQHTLANTPPL